MKHEMKLRPDFYKRLQKVNAELGTNLTAEEVLNLFFGKKQLFVEAIQHLIPKDEEERYGELRGDLTEDLPLGYTKTELKNILHYGRRLRES